MYQIITDGSCDLGRELAEKSKVEVVPFYISVDGENYKKEIEDIGVREFYEFMVENPDLYPKTSLPTADDYRKVFLKYAKKDIPVICICITSKFSGSYNSAMLAKQMILEDYPQAKLEVIDSMVNTVLQGTFVMELARCREAGASFEEIVKITEEIKTTGRIFFTVGNFKYLTKGGRIGKLAQVATDTLSIKPLITLKEGEIFPTGIVRRREKAKIRIIEQLVKYIQDNGNDPDEYAVNVGYGHDREEGLKFREQLISGLQSIWPDAKLDIGALQIGATIGVHTGPYPIGCGVIKKSAM